MQPLKILNNVQKARLLHTLFPEEITAFLGHLREQADYVILNREQVTEELGSKIFSAELWITLAGETHDIIQRYGRELEHSSPVFSEQLLGGYRYFFFISVLVNYTNNGKHTDEKFALAVDLLFN